MSGTISYNLDDEKRDSAGLLSTIRDKNNNFEEIVNELCNSKSLAEIGDTLVRKMKVRDFDCLCLNTLEEREANVVMKIYSGVLMIKAVQNPQEFSEWLDGNVDRRKNLLKNKRSFVDGFLSTIPTAVYMNKYQSMRKQDVCETILDEDGPIYQFLNIHRPGSLATLASRIGIWSEPEETGSVTRVRDFYRSIYSITVEKGFSKVTEMGVATAGSAA